MYKDSYVASLFSDRDNERKIITEINVEIIDGDRGKNYQKSHEYLAESEGFCLFLNAGNVSKRGFIFKDNKFVSKSKDSALRKGKLVKNDIVITTRGTVGNVAFYDKTVKYENIRINSGMVILRNGSNEINTKLLYNLLQSNYFSRWVERVSYGSAQPQLSVKIISGLKLPTFTGIESKNILKYFDVLDSSERSIEMHIASVIKLLKKLSDSIFGT